MSSQGVGNPTKKRGSGVKSPWRHIGIVKSMVLATSLPNFMLLTQNAYFGSILSLSPPDYKFRTENVLESLRPGPASYRPTSRVPPGDVIYR